ncbi:MAG TPA: hypothetical protein VM032_10280 [Vicinamibacterales bacterium]|nr:hypothetical protein [Vicinamibacterales bacterium]
MDLPRLSTSVRRITVLNRDESGRFVPVVVYAKKRKKRSQTTALKPIERLARRIAKANSAAAASYLASHEKANKKRRDGWLRDMQLNFVRAGRRGLKKLDPVRILPL